MREHLRQLAKPLGAATLLVALAVAAVFVAVGGPGLVMAQVLGIPPVPHTFEGREQCLACHGPNGVKAVPADHQGRSEATCQACHQAASDQGTPATSPTTTSTQGAGKNYGAPSVPANNDQNCLACHNASVTVPLADGSTITATVRANDLANSVHNGKLGCVSCHTDKASGFPHAKANATDARAYTTAMSTSCAQCHQDAAKAYNQSVHGSALAAGSSAAATCVDCHGAHNIADPARLERRPLLCASCHEAVTKTYQESVHGQLLAQGRADAASCLSCHTSDRSGHSLKKVDDPEGPTASKNVPQTCGTCHTQALQTYNSTFHGRAMRLGVQGKAPNCVDCHGAYGVQRVHGAESAVTEAKFANACAKCHSGASDSFASGWMGHEEASPSWFPVVFVTERFLFFLTSSVVAFGIVHVELDLLRWLVRRRKDRQNKGEK